MIQRETKTDDLLLSKTKNCERLIQQTHSKTEETMEFELTKRKKNTFFQTTNANQRIMDDRINKFRGLKFYFLYNGRK